MKTIREIIEAQLELYPLQNLRDIYKSFFQDEFGPGHLMDNPQKTRNYFEKELKKMSCRGRTAVEPCGAGIRFVRIPMELILKGAIEKDTYFSFFWTGASEFKEPEIETWQKKWKTIMDELDAFSSRIQNFEKDGSIIEENLKKGIFVMNHSELYRKQYDPHYRIFSLNQLKVIKSSSKLPYTLWDCKDKKPK